MILERSAIDLFLTASAITGPSNHPLRKTVSYIFSNKIYIFNISIYPQSTETMASKCHIVKMDSLQCCDITSFVWDTQTLVSWHRQAQRDLRHGSNLILYGTRMGGYDRYVCVVAHNIYIAVDGQLAILVSTKIYGNFLSFPKTVVGQEVEIDPHGIQGHNYSIYPILWLPMATQRVSSHGVDLVIPEYFCFQQPGLNIHIKHSLPQNQIRNVVSSKF